MGRYINKTKNGQQLPAHNKAAFITEFIPGAEWIPQPKEFMPDLVCVVQNGMFDAAAYCDSEREFKEFSRPDGRPKDWLIVPGVEELAK